jgi:hypothetical protein
VAGPTLIQWEPSVLEERSQRGTSRGNGAKTVGGVESRGVRFPADLVSQIERFATTHFPLETWPKLSVNQILTGLMYAGVESDDAPARVQRYIIEGAPNSIVNKVASAVESLTEDERGLLLKKLGIR